MTLMSARHYPPVEERFWAKVDRRGDCWLWTGPTSDGYGVFSANGVTKRVHRYAYELFVGPIPDGLVIDHLCRVRHCVNPSHMEPVTNKVNILRGQGSPAVNGRKTHCKRGHELTEENLYKTGTGGRSCRQCVLDSGRDLRKRRAAGQPTGERRGPRKTHCIHGHEYTEENTQLDRWGNRACRTCRRRYAQNRRDNLATIDKEATRSLLDGPSEATIERMRVSRLATIDKEAGT